MKRLMLVDGNALLHRAYHAYPNLTTSKGELIGAVYGFSNMLLTAIERLEPTHIAVAWDVGKETFRHETYKEYKAKRPSMDGDMACQIERTHEVVKRLNIPQYGIPKYEADDLIGTLSNRAAEDKGAEVVIVTGDRDALQLVKGKRVVVYMPTSFGGKDRGAMIFDEEAVKDKYGLEPSQIIDLKGLMGDASDNIKGVAGIGQVTATKLLQQAKSVEEVYQNLESLVIAERVKKLLLSGREDAFMSKHLATINVSVPLDFSWEDCQLSNYDKQEVVELFEQLEFESLMGKLPKDSWEEGVEDIFLKG